MWIKHGAKLLSEISLTNGKQLLDSYLLKLTLSPEYVADSYLEPQIRDSHHVK